MRGALLARNGKTILAMKSTAANESVSRIVPALSAQCSSADVRYVVTEHGIDICMVKIYGASYGIDLHSASEFSPGLLKSQRREG